ncbi:hypothetical protein TNCV_3854171 [Trichonephila clavipes]|nr:hypothetical protein TNCV_3854171 [Trichonephila clavipes]
MVGTMPPGPMMPTSTITTSSVQAPPKPLFPAAVAQVVEDSWGLYTTLGITGSNGPKTGIYLMPQGANFTNSNTRRGNVSNHSPKVSSQP